MPKNVRNLGKLIVDKGFKKLPKVQKTDQSGHTDVDDNDDAPLQITRNVIILF